MKKIFTFLIVLMATMSLMANTFNVDSTADVADSNPGDGVCDDGSGNCTLRAAIEEANALAGADIINLPVGTYTLNSIVGITSGATTLIGANEATTIIQAHASPGMGSDAVLAIFNVGNSAVSISNLTIRHGVTNSHNYAGGMFVAGSDNVTLTNVTISDNQNTSTSTPAPGGLWIATGSDVIMNNCTIKDNTSVASGGGFHHDFGTLVMNDCTISGNTSENDGGGGYIEFSCEFNRCVFSGNKVENSSSFPDNEGGGLSIESGSVVDIKNCIFHNNEAEKGGAIYEDVTVSTINIHNCTIYANKGDQGGGIFTEGTPDLRLYNCTIAGQTDGQGIWIGNQNRLSMVNCIVADNGVSDVHIAFSNPLKNPADADHNVVENCTTSGTGVCPSAPSFISTDPGLGTLTTCNGLAYYPITSSSSANNVGKPQSEDSEVPSEDICNTTRSTTTPDLGSFELFEVDNTLNFDGSNDYVSVLNNAAFELSKFTAEAWVKPTFTTNSLGYNPGLMGIRNGANVRWSLHMYESLNAVSMWTGSQNVFWGSLSFTTGTWYHLALVVDGTNAELFLNGVSQGTKTFSGITGTGYPFNIGDSGQGSEFFQGEIEEVRFWNDALNSSEISASYNKIVIDPTTLSSCVVAYYKMDETSGTSLPDETGNGHTGTLNNMAGTEWTTTTNTLTGQSYANCNAAICSEPSGMAASNITFSSADLSWTENGSSTEWNLEWKAGSDFTPGTGAQDGAVTVNSTTSHSLSSLSASTTYYVYYRSDCGSIESDWVGSYTFTTTAACADPSGMAASNITVTTADLTWTENGSATEWNLEWKAGGDFSPGDMQEDGSATVMTTATYGMSNLTIGTTYYVYYRSDCGALESNWVGPYTFTTLSNPFTTTWTVSAGSLDITIPTTGSGYSYNVDWGDGSSSTGQTGNAMHTYAAAGTYTVHITGTFPRIYFNNTGDKDKLTTIENWGNIAWTSMGGAFNGCSNMTYNATDTPDLSGVTNLGSMFSNCTSFNGNINNWNISTITNLAAMFSNATAFNQSLSNWDITSVTNFTGLFGGTTVFNQDLSAWNNKFTGSNIIFNGMFSGATAFNQNIGGWNTTNVTSMLTMFSGATAFNQDLSSWDVSNVTTMTNMFSGASAFDQNLGNWTLNSTVFLFFMLDGSGLSLTNYDNTLIGWEALGITGRSLGASGLKYCNGETARTSLTTTHSWTITGDSKECPCNDPSGMSASNITATSAALSWTENGSATEWNLEWKAGGDFTPGTMAEDGSATVMTTATYGMSNLTIGTTYYVYYRSDCGAIESNWVGPYTFTTLSYPFTTTWTVTSGSLDITIPTTGSGYSYNVDWGDGNSSTGQTGGAMHTYSSAGTYTVHITGTFPRIYFNNTGDKDKLTTIENWGNIAWTSMQDAFEGCSNMTYNATDVPNLGGVTTLGSMFKGCSSFNGNINSWNISNIVELSGLFQGATAFNQPLSNWDITSVASFINMFSGAIAFNQDLSAWNNKFTGSSSINFTGMFASADAFNQNIGSWNVSNVTSMVSMFFGADAFNQDISSWDVSNVNSMNSMFASASAFDQNLANWILKSSVDLTSMLNNSGLSLTNYDNTLIGWEALGITGRTLGASGLEYCYSETERTSLTTTHSWTITGDSKNCPAALYALDFDGTEDYVQIPFNAAFNSSEVTIEAWVKPEATSQTWSRIFSSGSGNEFEITQRSNNVNQFGVYTSDGGLKSIVSPTTWTAGQWYHIAMVMDGTSLSLYIDGALIGSVAAATGSSTNNRYIGGKAGEANHYFHGEIEEVRMWSGALDASEIAAIYNKTISNPGNVSACLVAYYKMDESSGISLSDASGNGNTGSLVNMAGTEWTASDNSLTSQGYNDCNAVGLPVELIYFRGQATTNGTLLTWQTASEINNEGFEIERSSNGNDWQNIGFVNGRGTTYETSDYQFTDARPNKGINYYRLKQMDYDGAFEYSDMVSVEVARSRKLLAVSPNPVQNGELTLYIPDETFENATLEIFNTVGQLVQTEVLTHSETVIRTDNLPTGMYWFSANVNGKKEVRKVIIE